MLDHVVQTIDRDAASHGKPADHPGKIDFNWPQLD